MILCFSFGLIQPSGRCRKGQCPPEGWTPSEEGCPRRWREGISPPPGHCWAWAHFHRHWRCAVLPVVSGPPPRRCASRWPLATRGRSGESCQVRTVQAAVPSCHPAPSDGSEGLSWSRELQHTGKKWQKQNTNFGNNPLVYPRAAFGFYHSGTQWHVPCVTHVSLLIYEQEGCHFPTENVAWWEKSPPAVQGLSDTWRSRDRTAAEVQHPGERHKKNNTDLRD